MTNLECIEYASKYSFKGLYEKGRADVLNDDNIVSQFIDIGYNKGRKEAIDEKYIENEIISLMYEYHVEADETIEELAEDIICIINEKIRRIQ